MLTSNLRGCDINGFFHSRFEAFKGALMNGVLLAFQCIEIEGAVLVNAISPTLRYYYV